MCVSGVLIGRSTRRGVGGGRDGVCVGGHLFRPCYDFGSFTKVDLSVVET